MSDRTARIGAEGSQPDISHARRSLPVRATGFEKRFIIEQAAEKHVRFVSG
jgi:hypothetical protein